MRNEENLQAIDCAAIEADRLQTNGINNKWESIVRVKEYTMQKMKVTLLELMVRM